MKIKRLAVLLATVFSVSSISVSAADLKIGLSNGWVGSEWRTQMISEAEEMAKAWLSKVLKSTLWSKAPMLMSQDKLPTFVISLMKV